MAVLDEQVNAADAEDVAGGVQLTSADTQIGNVNARDAVIARVEDTAVDQRVIAVVQMDTVRSADAGDIGHCRMIALVKLVHEVARILRRVAVERNVVAVREIDHVRTAVAFLTVGVIAMHAVDDGAFLTDDGKIVLPVCRNDGTAVFVPRLAVVLQQQKHVGVILDTFWEREYAVVVAVVRADQMCTRFQIYRRVGMHVKSGCAVGAGREDDLAAALTAEVKDRLQRVGLQVFGVCNDAVFGYIVDFHNPKSSTRIVFI